jgi:hypothetical protein
MKTLWWKNQENPSDRISHAWAPLTNDASMEDKRTVSLVPPPPPERRFYTKNIPVFRIRIGFNAGSGFGSSILGQCGSGIQIQIQGFDDQKLEKVYC